MAGTAQYSLVRLPVGILFVDTSLVLNISREQWPMVEILGNAVLVLLSENRCGSCVCADTSACIRVWLCVSTHACIYL